MISRELERIISAKNSIRESIINKGVNVPDNLLINEYPTLIDSITTGVIEANLGELNKTVTANGSYLYKPSKDNLDGYNRVVFKVEVPPSGIKVDYGEYAFRGNTNITEIDRVIVDDNRTSIKGMFNNCTFLQRMWGINANSITDMSELFSGCENLSISPYGWGFDTSNLTNISSMYNECKSLVDGGNISSLNTSNVTDISKLFNGCRMLQIADFSNCDLSKVTKVTDMFRGCENLGQIIMNGTILPKIDFYDWGLEDTSYLDNGSIVGIGRALPTLEDNEGLIVKIGELYLSRLSDAQKQVFTDKGWILM